MQEYTMYNKLCVTLILIGFITTARTQPFPDLRRGL